MLRKRSKRREIKRDPATENYQRGYELIRKHPMFSPLAEHSHIVRGENNLCPPDGWAVVTPNGYIHVHPTRRAEPEEWVYVLAHCLLHLGLGHFQKDNKSSEWNIACDCFIARFLRDFKLGRPPQESDFSPILPARTEEELYRDFSRQGIPPDLRNLGVAGPQAGDMIPAPTGSVRRGRNIDWQGYFARGMVLAVTSAISVAAGYDGSLGEINLTMTPAKRARKWFINNYPLLGSLASNFDIMEDPQLCIRLGIAVGAVDVESREIFLNSAAGLDEYECRFVIGHELLHVGLQHIPRRQGRDPVLWNIACDYVINGWLIEMGLGELPTIGVLYDPALKGESAERIYDIIVTDMRRFRKLMTLAGAGKCDMIERGAPDWWKSPDGVTLEELYRRCLGQGLTYYEEQGRGYLPAGLIEEIRALSHPPIVWEVELAQWFDDYFSPLEKLRSYARPSRRQSSTPDIPRPRYVPAIGAGDGRTFGVILDTSGSMDRALLAKALGAIASYSIAREVPRVRLIFCDAATYDQGYVAPEDIADRVKVKGRGGTILQPGIELLENADDFPKEGPLLIITDGFCDRLRIRREHAFLLPQGRHLPFVAKGKIFRIR
jgi:predicted metal-dependent peptidase